MKKTLVIGLAAIMAGGIARADYTLSTDITFASEYIFRGVKLADNTLHPSIEVGSDNFYLGWWAALPLEKRESGEFSDEHDFYAGYGFDLADNLKLDTGVTHYLYPESTSDSSTEVYAGISSSMGMFTPSFYLYYDFDYEVFTAQANLGFSIPMESLGTSLDLSAFLGSANPDEGDSYVYYGIDASVPFKLNDNATITVGIHWAKNDLDVPGLDDNHLFFTGGLTIGF